jgi:hypothetical protein
MFEELTNFSKDRLTHTTTRVTQAPVVDDFNWNDVTKNNKATSTSSSSSTSTTSSSSSSSTTTTSLKRMEGSVASMHGRLGDSKWTAPSIGLFFPYCVVFSRYFSFIFFLFLLSFDA